MAIYRVTTIMLVEADSEEEALEIEGKAGGDIEAWYADELLDTEGGA